MLNDTYENPYGCLLFIHCSEVSPDNDCSCTSLSFQLLARLGSRPSIKDIELTLFPSGAYPKDVIEISGEEGTGKTELLLHFLSQIILPKTYSGKNIGGIEAKAIFIDLDYKFSILRLASILEKKILRELDKNGLSPSCEEVESVIKQCLSNCLVLKCSSSAQLIVTLESLQKTVAEDPNIVAIFMDPISAFYWVDKCSHGDGISVLTPNMKLIKESLSKLLNGYNLTLFASKALIFRNKGKFKDDAQDGNPFGESDTSKYSHIEYLPKSWENFVQKRYTLEIASTEADGRGIFSIKSCNLNIPMSLNFKINESGVTFLV
ncbi:hypothetical protein FSP39_010202 [Pinctada imbricata]|uniref:RecA family profile 1 domain-containing protein n=1 Tax=Pinctada imbricata TaxID=66713 RepID=A0AA88XUY0_PINIB|nr:hypothetical protein FSP39_010202 [Pinctada imbricata]